MLQDTTQSEARSAQGASQDGSGSSQAEEPSGIEATSSADPSPDAAEDVGESLAAGLDTIGERVGRVVEDPSVDTAVAALGPLLVDAGLAIVGLLVLVVVVSFVSRTVRRLTRGGLGRLDLEPTVVNFLTRVAGIVVWVLALPVALEIFGIKTASFAAVIGAGGLAIGLAMQGALSNISAGIMLLVLRPFKIGDWVELDDEFGVVRDVGIFYTLIDTFSNKTVYLPNREVLGSKIEHFTANESRRVDIPVGVAYGTDLKEAMNILQRVADERSDSPQSDDKAEVILTAFGGSSIDFEVRVWCKSKNYLKARTDTILAIERALNDSGIEIPFPQRTLTFGGALALESRTTGEAD